MKMAKSSNRPSAPKHAHVVTKKTITKKDLPSAPLQFTYTQKKKHITKQESNQGSSTPFAKQKRGVAGIEPRDYQLQSKQTIFTINGVCPN